MFPRSLKLSFLVAALLLGAFAFAGRVGSTGQDRQTNAVPVAKPSPDAATHPFDALDRAVQQRFHNVIGFGMARIATERKFAPETKEEKGAVRDLKRAGYRVGLFLAGRGVLEPFPEQYRVSSTYFGNGLSHTMSGPVYMSSSGLKGLPSGPALWEPARRALLAFGGGAERQSFTVGKWEVEARPVRATNESCVQCHKDVQLTVYQNASGKYYGWGLKEDSVLRVGDTIGVLLYVYQKKAR